MLKKKTANAQTYLDFLQYSTCNTKLKRGQTHNQTSSRIHVCMLPLLRLKLKLIILVLIMHMLIKLVFI